MNRFFFNLIGLWKFICIILKVDRQTICIDLWLLFIIFSIDILDLYMIIVILIRFYVTTNKIKVGYDILNLKQLNNLHESK